METLDDQLRAVNPVRIAAQKPLDLRAEMDLQRILAGEPAVRSTTATGARNGGRAVGRRAVLIGAGAVAAAAAGTFATVAWPKDASAPIAAGPAPAVAAGPKMLEVRPLSVSAAGVIAAAREKLLAPDPAGFKPGYFQTTRWTAMATAGPAGGFGTPYVLPLKVTVRREADGTGTRTRMAGQPFSPTSPDVKFALPGFLDDGYGKNGETYGEARSTKPGDAVTKPLDPNDAPDHLKTVDGVPFAPPPADDAGMAAWIRDYQDRNSAAVYEDGQGVFQTLDHLSGMWNLTNAQERAYLSVVAGLAGVTTLGAVTDRMGRPGTAVYLDTVRPEGTYRSVLVLDDSTGRILAVEEDLIAGPANGRTPFAPVPSVKSYTVLADAS